MYDFLVKLIIKEKIHHLMILCHSDAITATSTHILCKWSCLLFQPCTHRRTQLSFSIHCKFVYTARLRANLHVTFSPEILPSAHELSPRYACDFNFGKPSNHLYWQSPHSASCGQKHLQNTLRKHTVS